MKRISLLLLFALSLVLLAACGGGKSESTDANVDEGTEDTATETETSGGDGDTQVIKLSHNMVEDNTIAEAVMEFKKEVESESNNELEIDVYPNLQLGSMQEQTEQVQMGSINMSLQSSSVLSPFTQDVEVLDLPFLWRDVTEMNDVLSGDLEEKILGTISDAGLKGLSIWPIGLKHFTSGVEPINGPEDLDGKKVRSMPSSLFIKQFETWGATPTPIDFGELYNALQQGVVDGQDNDLESMYSIKIHEVQDYLTLSGNNANTYLFFANEDWFEGLSEEHQAIIKTAAENARQQYFEWHVEADKEVLELIKESGVEVNELSEEAREKFIEASQPVYDEFIKSDIQQEIYDEIQAAVN